VVDFDVQPACNTSLPAALLLAAAGAAIIVTGTGASSTLVQACRKTSRESMLVSLAGAAKVLVVDTEGYTKAQAVRPWIGLVLAEHEAPSETRVCTEHAVSPLFASLCLSGRIGSLCSRTPTYTPHLT
jgi:hypothetical protein